MAITFNTSLIFFFYELNIIQSLYRNIRQIDNKLNCVAKPIWMAKSILLNIMSIDLGHITLICMTL